MNEKPNLLVTAAGRRNYVIEYLLEAAPSSSSLLVADASRTAPALSVRGAKPFVVPASGQANYLDRIHSVCQSEQVGAILSLHDFDSLYLARYCKDLESIGTAWLGASVETLELCLDKVELARHCELQQLGSSVPTLSAQGFLEADAPIFSTEDGVIAKDRLGCASSGLTELRGTWDAVRAQLIACSREGESRDSTLETRGTQLVVQPRIDAPEFNVDLFFDRSGSYRGSCVKRKIRMRNGETDAATVLTRPPERILDTCLAVCEGLDLVGNVDVDVFDLGDRVQVLDINPRFGGGYAFSGLAGYAAAAAVWCLVENRPTSMLAPRRNVTGSKTICVVEVRNDLGAHESGPT